MSLIDVAAELEYVPEQELIQLSQNPNSRFPQYLVLSEVQRRNQMRRMYENQVNKAEQPLTTVADEKVMELAQSSAMSSVPSPMSNAMSQSPSGLLGMASGRSTSKDEARQGIIDLMSDINIKRGEEGLSGFMDAAGDVASVGAAVIPINAFGKINMLEKAMRPLKNSFMKALKANEKGNVEYAKLDPLVKAQAKKYIELKKKQDKAYVLDLGLGLSGAVTVPFINAAQKGFDLEEIKSRDKKASGGLVSLQQGRTTDYQESIERSLQAAQGGQRGIPSDDPRLFMPYVPVESIDKSRARRTVLPPTLPDTLEAQNEQALLRESLASTGNLGETGTSQANISEGEPPKTKAEGTNVLQQIFDTSGQLGLPRVEIPRMTEEDKQRELGIYALGIMADAFGTGKNIGEAGSKLGKGVQGLLDIKRTQRQDDIKADSATRAQSVEEITLANTLLKTQLLADQYAKQGETNKVKALEILQEEIKEIKESTLGLSDETTKERIEKLQAQLDAELNRMFGTEALATYPGM